MSQPTSFRNVPGQGSLDFPLKGCDLLVVHAVSIKTATVGGGNPAQIPEEQPHAIAATHFPPVFQHKDTHATWQRPSTISIQTCNMASHIAPGSHQLGGFPYSETNQHGCSWMYPEPAYTVSPGCDVHHVQACTTAVFVGHLRLADNRESQTIPSHGEKIL